MARDSIDRHSQVGNSCRLFRCCRETDDGCSISDHYKIPSGPDQVGTNRRWYEMTSVFPDEPASREVLTY